MKPYAVIFPGQASQYVGMGADFISAPGPGRDIMDAAGTVAGRNLASVCLEGPIETLTATLVCQQAVFAVGLVCWDAFSRAVGRPPAAFAGHSLGEYTALTAADAWSVADGFRLVAARAAIMERVAAGRPGGMLAVVGATPEAAAAIAAGFPGVAVANLNAPGQTIVGGPADALERFAARCREQRIRTVPLKVSGAFHTALMEPAALLIAEALSGVPLRGPSAPVYANTSARPLAGPDAVRDELVRQVSSPVRWSETVESMAAAGIRVFVEVGPKRVLTALVEKILPGAVAVNVENKETLAAAAAVLTAP